MFRQINLAKMQTVQLASIKRKDTQPVFQLFNDQIFIFNRVRNRKDQYSTNGTIIIHNISIGMLLGAVYFLKVPQNELETNCFNQLEFQGLPKNLGVYMHEKTLAQLMRIMRTYASKISDLFEFVEEYPLASYVLEIIARNSCKLQVRQNKLFHPYTNEIQLLENFNSELRGPLLTILAQALKINFTLSYIDVQRNQGKHTTKDSYQEYYGGTGENDLTIKLSESEIILQIFNQSLYSSECTGKCRNGLLLIKKRSNIQSSSVSKQTINCSKCGTGKKCECGLRKLYSHGSNEGNGQDYLESPNLTQSQNEIKSICKCRRKVCICKK